MLRTILAAWILAAAARADQAVEVRVVNASTGAGIPDIALEFLRAGQIVYSGATGANGRFRIEAAKAGSYTVRYEAGEFWPAHDPPTVTVQVAGGPIRCALRSKCTRAARSRAGCSMPRETLSQTPASV
jgi:hypothetical protein